MQEIAYISIAFGLFSVLLRFTSRKADSVHQALIPTFFLAFFVGIYIISPLPVFAFWRIALLDIPILGYGIFAFLSWRDVFGRT